MADVKTLPAKIGELTLENGFLSGALGEAGLLRGAGKGSILPRSRASAAWPSSRGSAGAASITGRAVSDTDPKLMHRIDGLHMECPFAGSRMLQGLPVQEGFKAGRLHVATLPLVTLLRNALPRMG